MRYACKASDTVLTSKHDARNRAVQEGASDMQSRGHAAAGAPEALEEDGCATNPPESRAVQHMRSQSNASSIDE